MSLFSEEFKSFVKDLLVTQPVPAILSSLKDYVESHQQWIFTLLSLNSHSKLKIHLQNHGDRGSFSSIFDKYTDFTAIQEIKLNNYDTFFTTFTDTIKIQQPSLYGQNSHHFLQRCNIKKVLIIRSSPFLSLLLSHVKEKG